MNELRNGWPSTVPATFTSPRVPKNLTDSGQMTYTQPPALFRNLAVNRRLILVTFVMPLLIRRTERRNFDTGRPYAVKPSKRGYGHPSPGAGASVAST